MEESDHPHLDKGEEHEVVALQQVQQTGYQVVHAPAVALHERLKLAALEAKAAATRAELAVALGEPGTLPAGIAAAE